MSKITLLWMPDAEKPMRTYSLNKNLVYGVLAGFVACFVLTIILGAVSVSLWTSSSRYAFENKRLEALLSEKEAESKVLAEELKTVQSQENRIRRFLGLNEQSPNGQSKSNQGGSTYTPSSPDGENEEPADLAPEENRLGFIQQAMGIREGFQEILEIISERQDEARRSPSILPVRGEDLWIPSYFGWRVNPVSGAGEEFHNGLDIAGRWKAPVIAPADGTVVEVGRHTGYGNFIRISHTSTISTLYGHLADIVVRRGDHVRRGQLIGHMGNSGRSTGVHLHYSVIRDGNFVNPTNFIWDNLPDSLASFKASREKDT